MSFAVLGLGEAGSRLAADLVALGETVYGWDPDPKRIPDGVHFMSGNPEAASRSDIILSVNWASVSAAVAEEVLPVLRPGQLYADLNTASPRTKQQVGEILRPGGALFADVAIMAPILPRGIGTPVMVSGPGARSFAQAMTKYGMPVTVIGDEVGSAATRKLLRSVFYKGMAAVIIEALEAARRLDCEEWLREQMLTVIPDEMVIERMITGSAAHAGRRVQEMTAVSEMLREIGVAPYTSEAAVHRLTSLQQSGSSSE